MTDAELQGFALQALNLAKRELEENNFQLLLATYHAGEGIHRMRNIEKLFRATLGEDWLNHPRKKAFAFDLIRQCCGNSSVRPDAIVLVTGANAFVPTEAFLRLSREEQKAMENRGHEYHHQMVKDGLYSMHDILMAAAQTPERACLYQQKIDSEGEFEGQPQVQFVNMSEYFGITKFYGEPNQLRQSPVAERD